MSYLELKKLVISKIEEARKLIPSTHVADLVLVKAGGIQYRDWHDFEHEIWNIGEKIRQEMAKDKKLRDDKELQKLIVEIATDRKAKRGRQSFIMLLGYKSCAAYALNLIAQLDDEGVNGHIIMTVLKMGVPSYVKEIEPFTTDKMTWIRNYAKKYVDKYDNPKV